MDQHQERQGLQEVAQATQIEVGPYAGSLKRYLHNWEKVTNDKVIISWLRGLKLPFVTQPVQSRTPTTQYPVTQDHLIDLAITDLANIGAVTKCETKKGEFLSPYFLATKPNGKYRFILNLKKLNEHLSPPHFKLEDYRTVTKLITRHCLLAKLDLKDAYFLVPIHNKHKKYLRFVHKNQKYEFNCLPFGLNWAPYVFTKILKPVLRALRLEGVTSVIYLDDILLIGDTVEECARNVQKTTRILTHLGFIINEQKSVLTPTRKLEYLGFTYDTINLKMSLPKEKKVSIINDIKNFTGKTECKIQTLASLIGQLVAACPAVKYGRSHIKQLDREKFLALKKSNFNFSKTVQVSSEMLHDLSWWLENLNNSEMDIKQPNFAFEIYSDASTTGWGTYCEGQRTRGFWNEEESHKHINYLELLAALYSLQSFTRDVYNKHILLRIDNKTAISCINKMGSTQYKTLNSITSQIWEWCENRNLYVFASYIASADNHRADVESRCLSVETEYKLNTKTFTHITKKLGSPTIDLFASKINAKCQNYCSWSPDPNSLVVDSFTIKWDFLGYAFPPFAIIAKVLAKIIEDGATIILVVPYWPTQPWFPLFKKLCIEPPVFCRPSKQLLLSPLRQQHPLHKSLTLVAGKLSGRRTN